MKQTSLLIATTVTSLSAFAQTTQQTGEAAPAMEAQWYQMPVTWIVAAAILLALLVVLTRGGSKSQE